MLKLSTDKCILILKALNMLLTVKDMTAKELLAAQELSADIKEFTSSWQLDRGGTDYAPPSYERV